MEDSKASAAYNTVLRTLEKHHLHFVQDDEKGKVEFVMGSDDLDMHISIFVDEKRSLVVLYSHLPFEVDSEHRVVLARATGQVNYRLAEGSFDMNLDNGRIVFRSTTSYLGSIIGVDTIDRMLGLSLVAVDKYNDIFLALAKGNMSLADFYGRD